MREQEKINSDVSVELAKLTLLHKENKEDIEELKKTNKEELNLIKDLIDGIKSDFNFVKEEFSGFKQAVNIIKYSAIALVVGYLISEKGLIKALELVKDLFI